MIVALLLAALVVESLPLEALRWGVVAIVSYAAVMRLRSAARPPQRPDAAAGPCPSEGPAP